MTATACNVCGTEQPVLHHRQHDRDLLRCAGCGLVYVDPMPSAEEKAEIERRAHIEDLLPEVAEFFDNCHRDFREDAVIRGFRHGLQTIARHVEGGSMLDVGPGTGIFLHLAQSEFGWSPVGLDICPESAEKAGQEFGIDIDVGDFMDFDYEPASFDCITMLDMLEHTIDPSAVLARAKELLKPGGVLYVVVPNQRCLMTVLLDLYIRMGAPGGRFFMDRLYVPPHVYYFNPLALRTALERAGFEVASFEGGNVYLGRYRLPLWMRIPMEIALRGGSLVGMHAKLLALGRKP